MQPDLSALTPDQALQLVQSGQNFYTTMANIALPIVEQRRLDREVNAKISQNREEFAKQQEIAERLSKYDVSNILEAPADLLQAADKTSLKTLLKLAMDEKLAKLDPKGTISGSEPADVIKYRIMEQQRNELGLSSFEETPFFKAIAALKGKDFDEAKTTTDFTKAMLGNPLLTSQLGVEGIRKQAKQAAMDIGQTFSKTAPQAGGQSSSGTPGRTPTVAAWLEQQKQKPISGTQPGAVLEPAPLPVE